MATLTNLYTPGSAVANVSCARAQTNVTKMATLSLSKLCAGKSAVSGTRKLPICGVVLNRYQQPSTQKQQSAPEVQAPLSQLPSLSSSYQLEHETCLPIHISLSPDVVTPGNTISYPEALRSGLKAVKCLGVNGVTVDVWWGVVEAESPKSYDWSAYHVLLKLVRDCGMKAKVNLCFHAQGSISLPPWVLDEGRVDPDIFYTDRYMNRNTNYLSLGVDDVPVLQGRTALDIYSDFMRAFKQEFSSQLGNTITEVLIGMGPEGELKYPAHSPAAGWAFPGTGEFQCYDRYMLASLRACAQQVGNTAWGTGGPHDAGSYCQWPHESGFFNHHNGSWNTPYGSFFLQWYASMLIRHADRVLQSAATVFKGTGARLGTRLPAIHWWYNQSSHAAELTAGYYNTMHRDGYFQVLQCLHRHGSSCHISAAEMRNSEQPNYALSDPENLMLQLRTCAAAIEVPVVLQNQLLRYDEAALGQLEHHLFATQSSRGIDLPPVNGLVFHRLCDQMFEPSNWKPMKRFMKKTRERVDALDAAAHASRSKRAGAAAYAGPQLAAGEAQKVKVMA